MHPRRKYGWKLPEVIQQSSDLGVKWKQTTCALLYIVASTKWSRDSNWVTRLVTSKVDFRTIQIQCMIKFIWSLFYKFLLYSVGAHHNRFRCSKTDWITFCFPQNEQQSLEPVFLSVFFFFFLLLFLVKPEVDLRSFLQWNLDKTHLYITKTSV